MTSRQKIRSAGAHRAANGASCANIALIISVMPEPGGGARGATALPPPNILLIS